MNKRLENPLETVDELTPYLSMDGLAFKTKGDNDEVRPHNLKRAMDDLREWCMGRGNRDDAILAMAYLQATCAKARVFLIMIEQSFQYDEALDTEIIRKLCRPAYNGIVQRLGSGT